MAVTVLSTASASMVDVPTFIQPAGGDPNINYPGADMRTNLDMAYDQFGTMYPEDMVITAGSGRTINISAGRAVIPQMTEIYGGSYSVRATAAQSLTLTSTGVNYIFAEVLDKYYSGSAYAWQYWADTSPTAVSARSSGRAVILLGTVTTTSTAISSIDLSVKEIASSSGPWNNIPSYLNDFSNYGSMYGVGRYRRTGDGLVILDGLLKAGAASSSGDLMFNLPIGYRPSQQYLQTVMSRLNGNGNNTTYIVITINGGVSIYNTLNTFWLPAKTDWISMCGVVFSAAR